MSDVYYNLNFYNDSDSSAICSRTDTRSSPMLLKASDYKLSISKFSLPGNDIPTFSIVDDSYQIKYEFNSQTNAGDYGKIEAVSSLNDYKPTKFDSVDSFIECFNRASLAGYRDLLSAAEVDWFNILREQSVVNQVFTADDQVEEVFCNIQLNNTTSNSDKRLGFVEVEFEIYGTNNELLLELVLESPNGDQCVLTSGRRVAQGNTLKFHDASTRSQNDLPSDEVLSGTYQPLESFVKLNGADRSHQAIGTWKLLIKNLNNQHNPQMDITVNNLKLKCYCVPEAKLTSGTTKSFTWFPQFACTLNKSGDSLELVYDQNQTRGLANAFKLSRKLYDMYVCLFHSSTS